MKITEKEICRGTTTNEKGDPFEFVRKVSALMNEIPHTELLIGMQDFIDDEGLSPSWWTLGEEGAEDSGVEISSMSEYVPVGLPPFLLKALLKELRNCSEEIGDQCNEQAILKNSYVELLGSDKFLSSCQTSGFHCIV